MSPNQSAFTIGRLAKAADVNIETIRHYQRLELIIEPTKPLGGFRHYSFETVDRLRFIKRAKVLGFSLKEIKQLLLLGDSNCNDVRLLAAEKSQFILNQIKGLETIHTVLDELIKSCEVDDGTSQCAFIESLSEKGFLDNDFLSN